jgi:hypothetical protein
MDRDDPESNKASINILRRKLYSLSRKLKEERVASLKQVDIRSYFARRIDCKLFQNGTNCGLCQFSIPTRILCPIR